MATAAATLGLVVGGSGLAAAATGAATTTVNLRAGASTGTAVVGGLERGQRISTTGAARKGWVPVAFDGGTAYVAARYLDSRGALPALPTSITAAGTKITTENLNVRSGPSTSATAVGRLAAGTRVTLTGTQRAGFAQLRYEGRLRWVSVAYLAKATAATPSSPTTPVADASAGQAALAFAKGQLGKPYAYGAEGPDRYDCSGLTQAAWASAGVTLPRTAAQQYRQGQKVSRDELRPGDLVFFYSQTPSHVALYVGDGRIIHSPRPGKRVEYSTVDAMPYAGAVRPG